MKLEGIRVVDISNFLPGPHFTMMMADHGAEVIRVENTQGGEPNREIGSKRGGVTVYYTNTHRGKKSLSLDLKTPEGKEIFLKLLTALGREDLIPICEQPPGPAHDPVKKFLSETFLTKTWQEWIDWFEGRDICFAPVKTLREGFDEPHTHARQMLLKDERGWKHIGIPIKFRNEPGRVDFHAPELGENSREILESLNYSQDEIEALKAKGVCRTP